MTITKKVLFGVILILAILFVGFRWHSFFAGPMVEQPISYSHKIHTEMLKCEECHRGVINSAAATFPDIQVCMGCHKDQPLSSSPEEKKLLGYIKSGQNVPWRRLYKNPVHVYFSHSRHVTAGKLACETCHGEMGKTVKPPGRALVNIKMGDCISCHEANKVDKSCIVCHR